MSNKTHTNGQEKIATYLDVAGIALEELLSGGREEL
jgi:hypothetical protein